ALMRATASERFVARMSEAQATRHPGTAAPHVSRMSLALMRATARHSSCELQEKSRALTSREDAVRFQRQREQHDFVAGASRVDGARNRVGERGRNGNDPSLPYRANAERIRARRGIG